MAISPYIRELRAHIGTKRLLLPSVSAHIFDSSARMLLVRQRDSGVWSTPGGIIEPDESPADAVVRETWEETGLHIVPRRLIGVYGGPAFVVNYPNGDEAQYVATAFACDVIAGELRSESDETVEARYVRQEEARTLTLSKWLRTTLHIVYAQDPPFASPRWIPPGTSKSGR